MNNLRRYTWIGCLALVGALELSDARAEVIVHLDPASIEGLFVDIDTDSSKFEEYRDYESSVRMAWLHLHARDPERGWFLEADARNLPRRDARTSIEFSNAEGIGVHIEHNRIPHLLGRHGAMLWTRAGPGDYTLADPMQEDLQTAVEDQFARDPSGVDYEFLTGILSPYLENTSSTDIGLQRNRTLVEVDLGTMEHHRFALTVSQENRTGTRYLGSAFGFNNVTELPEPVDHHTLEAELSAEWVADRASVRLGTRYASFDNELDDVTWDNPFRLMDSTDGSAYLGPSGSSVAGASRGRIALAPDSESATLFADGHFEFGDWGWFWGRTSYTEFAQDEALLPYTTNTAINVGSGAPFDASDPSNLPTSHADREAHTLNAAANFAARLGSQFRLNLRFDRNDYDDDSRRISFPGYVRFDAVWEAIPRITVPYSYQRDKLGLSLQWELGLSGTMGLDLTHTMIDRKFREVDESRETDYRLTYDHQSLDWFSLRASAHRGFRTIDGYDTAAQEYSFLHPEGINNQPGLRKYDEAERDETGYHLLAQFFPHDAVSLSVGVTARDDDYEKSAMGLVTDESLQYHLDFGVAPGEHLSFNLFAHRQDLEGLQRARQSGGELSENPEDDWSATLSETTDTLGVSFAASFGGRWQAELDASRSRSDGEAEFTTPPGGTPSVAVGFGNYDDVDLVQAGASLQVDVFSRARLGVGYRYEKYTVDSFLDDGLQTYLPGALLLNADSGSYRAHVYVATLNVTF